MQTSNVVVGHNWTQVAADTDQELLVTWDNAVELEVAVTSANSAPTVPGHRLSRDDAVSRGVFPSGYVWVKLVSSGPQADVSLVVSK